MSSVNDSLNNTLNNGTLNNTTNEVYFKNEYISIRDWILVIAFSLIISFGVVGNAIVCYVFGYKKKRHRRSTTEWLILYLGIIDLLASILNPPLYIYWTVTHYSKWHFGYLGCKILPVLGPIMTSASLGILLIFAIDRYLAIVVTILWSGNLEDYNNRMYYKHCIIDFKLCALYQNFTNISFLW